jgi:hypothetical protein
LRAFILSHTISFVKGFFGFVYLSFFRTETHPALTFLLNEGVFYLLALPLSRVVRQLLLLSLQPPAFRQRGSILLEAYRPVKGIFELLAPGNAMALILK